MAAVLTLITRVDCCLCDEMKETALAVAAEAGATVEVCDVDADPALHARFSDEVPVLLINGRKAFKYRCSAAELRRQLARANGSSLWRNLWGRIR